MSVDVLHVVVLIRTLWLLSLMFLRMWLWLFLLSCFACYCYCFCRPECWFWCSCRHVLTNQEIEVGDAKLYGVLTASIPAGSCNIQLFDHFLRTCFRLICFQHSTHTYPWCEIKHTHTHWFIAMQIYMLIFDIFFWEFLLLIETFRARD